MASKNRKYGLALANYDPKLEQCRRGNVEAKLVFPYKAGWDLADRQEAEVSSCADPNKTLEAHLFLLLCFTGRLKKHGGFSL